MLKFAFLLFLGLATAPMASAAIFRVDVTGTGSGGYAGLYSGFTEELGFFSLGFLDIAIEDVPDDQNRSNFLRFSKATSGQMFFSTANGGQFYDCVGLLEPMCFGGGFMSERSAFDDIADTFEAFSGFIFGGGSGASNSGLRYTDDGAMDFQIGNLRLIGDGRSFASYLNANFTTVDVTAVPLPATSGLLLAAFGGLFAHRRRARQQ